MNGISVWMHLQKERVVCPQCGSTARIARDLCLRCMLSVGLDASGDTSETLDDLLALEGSGRRLWLVTTLERVLRLHDTRLYDHIRGEYRRIAVLPASVGDGEMRIYEQPTAR